MPSVLLSPAASALVYHGADAPHPLALATIDAVDLAPGEVLVEIELATVCGSDLHTVSGARTTPTPLVLGHEHVGRVLALGDGQPAPVVDATSTATDRVTPLAVGDRVVWGISVACGECRMCRRGVPNKCAELQKYGHEPMRPEWSLSGSIASHAHLRAGTSIVRVPETLPAELLAPAPCATATVMAALSAASEIRPLSGELAVVTGCGMLGLTAIVAATVAGAQVIAVDPDPLRREAAVRLGAIDAVSPGARELRAALAARGRDGFDVAWELSGSSASVADLLEIADTSAVVVLVGSVFPAAAVDLSAESVVRRLLTIRGVHNYRPEHLVSAVRFLATPEAAGFADLVGEILPLSRAAEAFAPRPDAPARIGIRP